jgi:hypothetical protein
MKRGTPTHYKTKRLAKKLKVELPHAVGILEMLWHFKSDQAHAVISDALVMRRLPMLSMGAKSQLSC